MKSITPEGLRSLLASNKPYTLIDVREGWERNLYHIGGIHLPLGEVMQHRNEIPVDRCTIIYCEKGVRSAIIIQRLEAVGFNNLYNLAGGISAWKKAETAAGPKS